MPCRQRVRHRVLATALKRNHLTQDAAAKILGMSPQALGALIKDHNRTPRRLTPRQQEILCAWTGKLPEELWPTRTGRNGSRKVSDKLLAAQPSMLADRGLIWRPPQPDEQIETVEHEHCIQRLLTPGQALLVRGLIAGQTYADLEIALTLTRGGISYRLQQALRRLRHPRHARMLKALV